MQPRDVRPGDIVLRSFGAGPPVRLRATHVDDQYIYVGAPGTGWKFDRDTGAEVDERRRWGPAFGRTGSKIIGVER